MGDREPRADGVVQRVITMSCRLPLD